MLGKALLSEVLNRIIIGVCHKVLDSDSLSMGFKSIHQPCAISFNLLRCWNGQKYNFCKSLTMKRPKHTPTKNRRFSRSCEPINFLLRILIASFDNHCLMLTVHHKSYDIVPRHPWELLCDNILEINQISHRGELSMICKNTNKMLNFRWLTYHFWQRQTQFCLDPLLS